MAARHHMPFGETLTLLATLANAYQALRFSRPPEATAAANDPEPAIDPALLIALDASKTANDETVRRHDAASNGAHLVIGLSAATLLVSAFLGAVSSDAPEGSSPLFIASVIIFIAITLGAIVTRRSFALRPLPSGEDAWSGSQQAVERLLKRRQQVEEDNRRRLSAVSAGGDVLLLVVALQVVLAAVWLIH
ncbi:MAG: hypothetical protein AB7P33_06200 [Dehalococcoidia bacterium]